MKWMVPKNKLSANQIDIADSIVQGSTERHWVSGYAGSGKTVVITHSINELATRFPTHSIGFLTYTHALKDMVQSGLSPKVANRVSIETLDSFYLHPKKFDHLFIDEIQDVEQRHLPKILAASKHLVVAGDPDQSIYRDRLDALGLRKALGVHNRYMLHEVYRFSKNTLEIAKSVYPEAELSSGGRLRESNSVDATLSEYRTEGQEITAVWEAARDAAVAELPSAVLFPQHKLIHQFARIVADVEGQSAPPIPTKTAGVPGQSFDYTAFNQFFESARVPLRFLGSKYGSFEESDSKSIVYCLTYHSAKGLDFQNTFLPFLNSSTRIKENYEPEDLGARKFLVAVTRARYQQNFSYSGRMHPALAAIPRRLFKVK
jgi:superfamily I DNA/RNA helicase